MHTYTTLHILQFLWLIIFQLLQIGPGYQKGNLGNWWSRTSTDQMPCNPNYSTETPKVRQHTATVFPFHLIPFCPVTTLFPLGKMGLQG